MKAKSIKGNSTEETKIALTACMADGFKPTLAIVFISVKQNRETVSELLDKNGIAVFGVTTNGEFIDEEPQQGTIAILLLDIKPESFFIRFAELDGIDDKNTKK